MTPEVRHKAIAAAWAAWRSRHGDKLGPGPAFTEAIDAALAVILAPAALQGDAATGEVKDADGNLVMRFSPGEMSNIKSQLGREEK